MSMFRHSERSEESLKKRCFACVFFRLILMIIGGNLLQIFLLTIFKNILILYGSFFNCFGEMLYD